MDGFGYLALKSQFLSLFSPALFSRDLTPRLWTASGEDERVLILQKSNRARKILPGVGSVFKPHPIRLESEKASLS